MKLAGIGAYAPRFRLSADAVRDAIDTFQAPGIDSVAVPDADEDPVTMAWEASTRALDAGAVDGSDLDAIYLASTTLPTLDESPVPHLATAFDAPAGLDARVFSGSSAASGEALATAIDRADGGPVLVVASDAPTGDPDSAEGHAAGAGAAALVLTSDGPGAIIEHGTATASYPGTRFRPEDEPTKGLGITTYDRQAYSELLTAALDDAFTDGSRPEFDAAAVTMPDGKLPYRAAGAAGIDTSIVADVETVSDLGDTGAAGPLLGLATALDDGASDVLIATYGSGATCHAFHVQTDAGALPVAAATEGDVELDYAATMRQRGAFSTGAPSGGGANVPVPTYRRSLPERYRLRAGACVECEELVFPAENACPACGAREGYVDVDLSREGRITATTVIGTGGAPPEFVDQQNRSGEYGTAIVQFEDIVGRTQGRTVDIPLQVVLTAADESPEIGDRVSPALRVLYEQHGVRRYGLKAILSTTRR